MGKRWSWVAWSMLAVFVVSLVVGLILAFANGSIQQDATNQLLLVLGLSAFAVVGALVAAHRPSNPIGWIFSAIALLSATGQLAGQYAIYAYATTRPESLPGARLAAWYGSWPWFLVLSLTLVFTPLLFPTGRLLSPRWRPVAWLAGGAAAVLTALTSLRTELSLGTVPDHRLYDIDRLINRTLVYGLLTALLAGVYAAVVLVLGQGFGGLGDNPPSWVIAGATLAVAALFQPARHRIQQAVDRRFNRRRYDTARMIQAYSVRLRDEVDLDTLSSELLTVVDQTMEPTRALLWLRPAAPAASGTPRRPTTWAY
jgi:hypothetical protein